MYYNYNDPYIKPTQFNKKLDFGYSKNLSFDDVFPTSENNVVVNNSDIINIKCSDVFTQEQKDAIKTYTKHGDILLKYYTLNNMNFSFPLYTYYLKNTLLLFNHMIKYKTNIMDYMKYIDDFNYTFLSCFKIKFNRNVILYRGISGNFNCHYNVYTENKYLSTSASAFIALKFSKKNGIIIKYIVPKGTYVLPVYCKNSSYYRYEMEIVLRPRTIYMCVSEIYEDVICTARDKSGTDKHVYYTFNKTQYSNKNYIITKHIVKCIDVVVINND